MFSLCDGDGVLPKLFLLRVSALLPDLLSYCGDTNLSLYLLELARRSTDDGRLSADRDLPLSRDKDLKIILE